MSNCVQEVRLSGVGSLPGDLRQIDGWNFYNVLPKKTKIIQNETVFGLINPVTGESIMVSIFCHPIILDRFKMSSWQFDFEAHNAAYKVAEYLYGESNLADQHAEQIIIEEMPHIINDPVGVGTLNGQNVVYYSTDNTRSFKYGKRAFYSPIGERTVLQAKQILNVPNDLISEGDKMFGEYLKRYSDNEIVDDQLFMSPGWLRAAARFIDNY